MSPRLVPVEGCGHRRRHVHGTRSAYATCRCRCEECRGAAARYARAYGLGWRGPAATGEKAFVPGEPVRLLLEAVHQAGHSCGQIARAMGVSTSQVHRLRANRTARVTVTTAARVEAVARAWGVRRPASAEPMVVDAAVAVRQVRALAVLGWTTRQIAAVASLNKGTVSRLQDGRASALATTVVAVAGAYRHLAVRAPSRPDPRTVSRARAGGWLSPAQWEDIEAGSVDDAVVGVMVA